MCDLAKGIVTVAHFVTAAALTLTLSLLRRNMMIVLQAAIAVFLGVGLAAFYLVPAVVEREWVNISSVLPSPSALSAS